MPARPRMRRVPTSRDPAYYDYLNRQASRASAAQDKGISKPLPDDSTYYKDYYYDPKTKRTFATGGSRNA